MSTTVASLTPGDELFSPFSGEYLTVESTASGYYGTVELTCRDDGGNLRRLTLEADERVTVTA